MSVCEWRVTAREKKPESNPVKKSDFRRLRWRHARQKGGEKEERETK